MPAALPTGLLLLPAEATRSCPSLWKKLRLLVVHNLLQRSTRDLPPDLEPRVLRLRPPLAALLRRCPAAMLAAAGSQEVLASLLACESGMISYEQALRTAVPNFLLHLALRAPPESHEATLLWDLPVTRVIASEDETLVDFAPPARGLLIDRRTIDFRLQDDSTHSWQALAATAAAAVPAASRFARLSSGAQLSLIDTNPLAALEEHPDKQGNAVDLGGQDLGAWRDRLESAFTVIRETLPTLFGEMSTTVDRIVPVGVDPHRHFSASYREAPGLMYLSLHPSTLTMAEAIVHESQHSKLNAVSWFDAVLENGRTAWTKSPVRPDLRPLMGVLLAVHAFVPVAAMHLRLAELGHPLALDAGFAQRRAQVLAANADGLNTLRELAQPTTLGSKVLGALFELHAAVLAASPALSPRPPGTGGQRLEELG